MHRAWARRRAWRVRLGLAAGLALVLLPLAWGVHPAWALLSGLALLYPSRWEEERALAELDRRYGLAYRSALEAPPDHPWRNQLQAEAETSLRTARLPPWPWALVALYLLSLGLVWLLPGAQPVVAQPEAPTQTSPPSSPAATPPFSAPDEVSPTAEGSSGEGQEAAEGEQNEVGASPAEEQPAQTSQAQAEQNPFSGNAGAEPVPEQNQSTGEASPGPGQLQPPSSPQGQPGGEASPTPSLSQPAPGREGQPMPSPSSRPAQPQAEQGSSQGSSPGEQPAGGSPGDRPTGSPQGQAPSASNLPSNLPSPAGEAPVRGGEAGQGRPQPLPSPWAAGQPPQNVQRQAEKYLQSEPLPPEVRRILRRYFELPP
ncbi:hypothetical protein [Meiothermus rufus]|uniref:hypothetical protein n=1 Tax=Meiothermus rufus TaxID=604332 RepID=UPI0004188A3D|nr:hypothetical protein [Meiothermus rufus]